MPDYAVVEIEELPNNDQELADLWNKDDQLSDLGTAQDAGDGAPAFPLDPASLGTALLISIAANVTTAALVSGVKALMAKARPKASFEVEVVHATVPGDAIRVKVIQHR